MQVDPKKRIVQVLVSACLTGQRVRYDGAVTPNIDAILVRWVHEKRVVPYCPEVAGGLPVPRPPAEIADGDGVAVLNGDAAVMNVNGDDVTAYFLEGAEKAVELARSLEIKIAVLKDKSPSCGSTAIYDGSFSGRNKSGRGVTTVLLEEAGVRVFSEREIPKADAYLKTVKP
ncbi:MAG: DUF523 domain-containing protein [Deltaproteobacteria bacterium]|nr:DUF523 domain-containing protein [Deltaproteobacteria bacterium]